MAKVTKKRWVVGLSGFAALLLFLRPTYGREEALWQRSDKGIDETSIMAISALKDMPDTSYAGGRRGIYKSVDSGTNWSRVFMLKSEREGVNFITSDPQNPSKIFAATGDGLYVSEDAGARWDRCFRGDDSQREVTCILIDNTDASSLLIGTKRGLFESRDSGRNWSAESSFINKEIISIAMGKEGVYVCAADGLYYAQKGDKLWNRIYVQEISQEESTDSNDDDNESDEEESLGVLNHISIFQDNILLATDKGIFIKKEKDPYWEALGSSGLLTKKVRFVQTAGKLAFAATDRGVFFYGEDEKRWIDISAGLDTLDIKQIEFIPDRNLLYAATDKGIYKAEFNYGKAKNDFPMMRGNETISENEPAISEIQQAAIDYAEVSHRKIEWMRSAAKNKSWLPNITAGLDGDVNRTIDLDRGGTNDADFYILGPKDKGWGWDVSATWDLGELIWNDDQTNIDVRSRLMVQLRNDILDEVTKLYFERRRLKQELCSNPPKDEEKIALKELRLEELTANIDALTNGYLSRYHEKMEKQRT